MYNPWIIRSKLKRVVNSLAVFLGSDYREVTEEITVRAKKHPDWQNFFVIFIDADDKHNITRIEITEQEI